MNNVIKSTFFLFVCTACLVIGANAQKTPAYKITGIKMVPFEEQNGKFGDPITPENPRSFFNDLSTSLFVTIELSGKEGSFEPGRKLAVTVTEGKRVKYSKTEQVGLMGEGGKYYVPVWLYSAMCDTVTIKATLIGQSGAASSMTRKVPFMCGE